VLSIRRAGPDFDEVKKTSSGLFPLGLGACTARTAFPAGPASKRTDRSTLASVEWYWLGVSLGLGVAAGVLAAALVGGWTAGLPAAILLGAAAGVGAGLLLGEMGDAVAGAAGGIVGGASAGVVVRGALARGGTRGATGLLVGVVALIGAALAFVPVLGFVEAVAVPVLARRAKQRSVERYAGLRTLAR
jgi:hypothetical protein